MNTCSSCQKAIATVHVLDVEDNSVLKEEGLCEQCAKAAGHIQGHIIQETLQNLINMKVGQLQGSLFPGAEEGEATETQCPACGMGLQEFKAKGRLGCARCYETFRGSLVPLLERVHDASSHRGRYPSLPDEPGRGKLLSDLHRKLKEAIHNEDYEAAANLRDEIKTVEDSE